MRKIIASGLLFAFIASPAFARCPRDPYTGQPDRDCIYQERQEYQPQRQTVCEQRPPLPYSVVQTWTTTCHEE